MDPDRVVRAWKDGRITRNEADAYLRRVHGTTFRAAKPSHVHAYAVLLAMAFVIVAASFLGSDGLAGLAVFDPAEDTLENLTSLSVSGAMRGEGSASFILVANGTNYTVAAILSDNGEPRTARASYRPGENVTLQNIRGNATYYLDDGNSTIPVSVPFDAPAIGAYEILIVMNDSGRLSTARTDLTVSNETVQRTTVFENVCEQTCTLPGVSGTLIVRADNVTVNHTVSYTTAGSNLEPVLIMPFENVSLQGTTTIDLGVHFEDPEGEQIFFDVSGTDVVNATVEDTLLKLSPLREGSERVIVYASDLEHLVQESFTVTVSDNTTSVDDTVRDTTADNTTVENAPTAGNRTNATANRAGGTTSLGCEHPNPNRRPVECLQNQTDVFRTADVFWENPSRRKMAKINPLGNLLIRGEVIERTNVSPESEDLAFGPLDRLGRQQPLVWIDSDTGDLHVAGELHEEQLQLNPPSGSYGVKSRSSLYLLYVDYGTGDLYLRGNVIPLRGSVG